jgi:hypothetical protein
VGHPHVAKCPLSASGAEADIEQKRLMSAIDPSASVLSRLSEWMLALSSWVKQVLS